MFMFFMDDHSDGVSPRPFEGIIKNTLIKFTEKNTVYHLYGNNLAQVPKKHKHFKFLAIKKT